MSTPCARVTYRFGEFEADPAAYELRHNGRRIRLARQPMDLLLLLLERRQELVTREVMAKQLWKPGRLHRCRCRHPHGDPQDSTGPGRLVRVTALRGDRVGQRLSVHCAGRGRRIAGSAAPPALQSESERLPDSRRHNLPAELTTFVGRRQELRELPRLLTSSRLVSLTGAGGVGKTRLAVRLARDLVEQFPHGVWLIDLAPLSCPI